VGISRLKKKKIVEYSASFSSTCKLQLPSMAGLP